MSALFNNFSDHLNKIITYILLLSIILPGIIKAQKTDTIRLTNGDVVTGEIKFLSFGNLIYKTDGMITLVKILL